MNAYIEQCIAEMPEQYNWMHRRFNLRMLKESIRDACRANGLVFMVVLGAAAWLTRD